MTEQHDAGTALPWRFDAERLMQLIGEAISQHEPGTDPAFAAWLVEDAVARQSPAQRAEADAVARAFAARTARRLREQRAAARLAPLPMIHRSATVTGDLRDAVRMAAGERCVGWLGSSAVAAGVGRELWDEPCDSWLELPETVLPGNQIALPVSGDSMEPVLQHGDGIIVDLDARTQVGCVVVARHPEHGYVVKCVGDMGRTWIELESFNTAYPPFRLRRSPGAIVGVVVARVRRASDASDALASEAPPVI